MQKCQYQGDEIIKAFFYSNLWYPVNTSLINLIPPPNNIPPKKISKCCLLLVPKNVVKIFLLSFHLL